MGGKKIDRVSACVNDACSICNSYVTGCPKPQKKADYVEKWGYKTRIL